MKKKRLRKEKQNGNKSGYKISRINPNSKKKINKETEIDQKKNKLFKPMIKILLNQKQVSSMI